MKRNDLRAPFLGILWTCLLLSTGTQWAQAEGLRLDGAFIQYQDWMKPMDAQAWQKELEALRQARFRLVIVQWLQENQNRYIPDSPAKPDPTEILLAYADRHAMQVFVGLTMDDAWWRRSLERDYLDGRAKAACQVAETAWRRFGKHRSFAGWYIPQETWDGAYTAGQIESLRAFFRQISDRCKALSGGKPVAFSPFFAQNSPPKTVEAVYGSLLAGAGIDILMLQDGVGARGWDGEVADRVVPYFRAFRKACLRNGVAFWSDLEAFRLSGKASSAFVPADMERIGRQLTAEAPFVQRFVTFDFFHYLSPYRGEAQKRLYDRYLQACVAREFLPTLGRSVEVDPQFAYYRNRSPESIASEIRANGYDIVRYILTADSAVNPKLVTAFHREGIGVWYATFANGVYTTKDLPSGWTTWKMVTRSNLQGKPLEDGYTRLCLNNPAYRTWKKAQIGKMLRQVPFEGVDLMEPHWPEYPGITSPAYACFCAHCLAAFRKQFPEERALPNILDTNAPNSPDRNPALWQKWLTFRKESLTDFLNDLVNGKGGIRETAPQAKICVWTLALSEESGLRRVREDSGEDPGAIARQVRPDLFCLQTHWPDWTRAELPPDYVKQYRPFVEDIRAASPTLPIMVQADTGSQKQNRRSWAWIEAFERACTQLGAGSTTLYEYFIGDYIYTDPPQLAELQWREHRLELRFTKRLAPGTANKRENYVLSSGHVTSVEVDGNRVFLSVAGVSPGARTTLTVKNMADDTRPRLYQDRPATRQETLTVTLP